MDDCMQMIGLLLLVVVVMAGMAVVLTWEPKGARRPDTCPYCVAVARSKPAVGHCWRCGGRYDKARYSVDWGAVNLDLFRGYHGHDPEGFMGDRETPPNKSRPEPPGDSYRKDRHE
jgi:hypothetical protein